MKEIIKELKIMFHSFDNTTEIRYEDGLVWIDTAAKNVVIPASTGCEARHFFKEYFRW